MDNSAFIIFLNAFHVLAIVLNLSAIACIIYLYVKRAESRKRFPKLFIMLVCCLLQFVHPVCSLGSLHLSGERPSCGESQALRLYDDTQWSTVTLLVAAVLFVEALRLQNLVSLTPRVQMGVALVLVVLSVVYGFVVIIPTFYFAWLKDHTKPCIQGIGVLDIDQKSTRYKALPAVAFIIPHCFVFMSCLLLLVAHFTRRCGHRAGVCVQYSSCSLPLCVLESGTSRRNAPGTTNPVHSEAPTQGDPSTPQVYTPLETRLQLAVETRLHMTFKDPQETRPFPLNLVFAGVVSFALNFLYFFREFLGAERVMNSEEWVLWNAAILLSLLTGVFLPCCWLLDGMVRTVWCCCCRDRRA